MQSKNTILSILESAIAIANKLALTSFTNEQDYKQDAVSLLGYLRAMEALVKHDVALPFVPNTSTKDNEKAEIDKINRKLRLWAERSSQINSIILTSFLRLKYEDSVGLVTLDMLKARYQKECIAQHKDKFKTNFDQMKTISDRNHAKVFDVDSMGCVTIWPNALGAVEEFRKQINMRDKQWK